MGKAEFGLQVIDDYNCEWPHNLLTIIPKYYWIFFNLVFY